MQFNAQDQRPRQSSYTGFATKWTQYCTGELKVSAIERGADRAFLESPAPQGADTNSVVQYIGIAADEPERLERLVGTSKRAPLAELGWTEEDAYMWCIKNKLLSPIYTTSDRGGCWFCHNQTIASLRLLRKRYPHLWALMMKWDLDSPVTFHSDGRTIHDFDLRFSLEMQGKVPCDRRFRWKMIDELKEDNTL